MTSVNGIVHMEEFSAPESSMLLRERVKRLLGNNLHASWKSLPEVKSSGLLGKLTVSHSWGNHLKAVESLHSPLKLEYLLNNIYKFSSYPTRHTQCHLYKNQLATAI
jgi:hypothetical protein